MEIVQLKTADLIADPANVRKHDERNIETIVGSLHRFGQQKPIVVDKSGVVRAGNGTLEAARRLGWETIAAHVSELTGSEMTAYAIADNRSSELAEWDDAALAAVLEGLQFEDDALLEVAGFSSDEVSDMLAEEVGDLKPGGAIDKALQLVPDREYVVIMCESEQEWEEMKELLELQSVRRGGYKKGSAFDAVGTQRVLKWCDMIKRLV